VEEKGKETNMTLTTKTKPPLLSNTDEPEGGRPPRWTATFWYRSNAGPVDVVHTFEELYTLHDLIELGPSFYCVERIEIRLSTPARAPALTLESPEA
jgi:hypothetical protein